MRMLDFLLEQTLKLLVIIDFISQNSVLNHQALQPLNDKIR